MTKMKKRHLWGTARQMADSTGVHPLAQQQGNPKIHSPTHCVCDRNDSLRLVCETKKEPTANGHVGAQGIEIIIL